MLSKFSANSITRAIKSWGGSRSTRTSIHNRLEKRSYNQLNAPRATSWAIFAGIGVALGYLYYKSEEEPCYAEQAVESRGSLPRLLKRTSSFLIQTKEETGCPGIVAAVYKKGELVYEGAMGWSDVENLVPMSPDSVLRIASISKSLTSAALGILVDAKKLDLDKPIAEYLPVSWWPVKTLPDGTPAVITSRQLASHHAGIRSYKNDEFESIRDPTATVEEALRLFREDPLLHAPGEKFLYSTHAYTLLAAVIEAVSEEHYMDFMEANILRPLGLLDTRADYNDDIIMGRVHYYYRTPKPAPVMGTLPLDPPPASTSTPIVSTSTSDTTPKKEPETDNNNTPQEKKSKKHASKSSKASRKGVLRPCPSVDNSWKWAGGGFVSTARDIAKFGDAVLSDKLFSPTTRKDLWTAVKKGRYGVGWTVKHQAGPNGTRIPTISHSGGAIGSSSQLYIYPDEQVVVAIIGNLQDVNFEPAAVELASIWRDYHL